MNTNHPGLTQYLALISQTKRITHEEEKTATPEQLIAANLRLSVYVAKRWADNPEDLLDRIQDGNVGLLEAAQKFDPSFGVHFSTYAVHYIANRIRRGVVNSSRVVRMSHRAYRLYKQAYGLLDQGLSYSEIAARLEINQAEVASMFTYGQDSLDETPTLADNEVCEIDIDMAHVMSKAERVLSPRELDVMKELLAGRTLDEIGEMKNRSREAIRLNKALGIHKLSSKYASD